MSEAGRPDLPVHQMVDLPPHEQSQPQITPLWYPYDVTRMTLCSSYMNIFLVFVPVGIAAGVLGWDKVAVFSLNFLAILGLAPLIAFSTAELSASIGRVSSVLLTEALNNAVAMIVRNLFSVLSSTLLLPNAPGFV
jgi:hypothetical protein